MPAARPLTLVTLTLVCVAALVALAGVELVAADVASGVVLAVGEVLAAASASIAKWVLLGRLKPSDHPLWSSLVWRNELADMFVELLAAPWFAHPTMGTPALNAWFRTMGAKVGEGVWCETYWLPEADLIDLRAGVTVNAGCVCRPTCFTTGCSAWTPSPCGRARHWAQQCDSARGHRRTTRYDRPGIAGHAR